MIRTFIFPSPAVVRSRASHPHRFSLRSSTVAVALALALVIGTSGCSKKEDKAADAPKSSTGSSAATTLIDRLPASTYFFSYLDVTTPGFDRWTKSSFGQLSAQLQDLSLSMLESPEAQASAGSSAKLLKIGQQAGLLWSGKNTPVAFKEIVSFYADSGQGANDSFPIAYFISAAKGVDMTKKLTEVEKGLLDAGFVTTKGKEPNTLSVVVPLPPAADPTTGLPNGAGSTTAALPARAESASGDDAPRAAAELKSFTLHLKASTEYLGAASSESLLNQLFNPTPQGLVSTPRYLEAKAHLPQDWSKAVNVNYADFEKAATVMSALVPQGQESAEINAAVKNLPIPYAAGYLLMEENPSLRYAMPIQPKNDKQREVVAALKKLSGSIELLNVVPEQSILVLALNGDAAMQVAELSGAAEGGAAESTPPFLKGIKGAALGVANASGASPFPELFLAVQSPNAAQLVQAAKAGIGIAAASSGMPAGEWQRSKVAGVDVDMMPSPLGVGLYLGYVDTTVFAATSETMVKSIVEAKSSGKGIAKSVPQIMKSTGTPLLTGYLSGQKLYGLLESVQGTLAMFTGGKTNLDLSKAAALKTSGSGTFILSIDGDVLRATGDLIPPAAQ